MKKGTEYELLVKSLIEKLIKNDKTNLKNLRVQHNVKLKGNKTGLEHQLDVYCEFVQDGETHKYAIECKDYASRLEKEKIAAFWGILDDLEDVNGIYVCRNGYQSGALTYAKTYGISVMEIRQPTDKDMDGRIQDIAISIIVKNPRVICTNLFMDNKWLEVHYEVGTPIIKREQGGKIRLRKGETEFTLADIIEENKKNESEESAFYVIDEEFENTFLISNGNNFITLNGREIDCIKITKLHLEYTYEDELFTEFSVFGDRLVDVIAKNAITGKIAFCDNKGGVTWVDK